MTYQKEITQESKEWIESTKEVDAVDIMITFADYWRCKKPKSEKPKGCKGCDCKDGICFNY